MICVWTSAVARQPGASISLIRAGSQRTWCLGCVAGVFFETLWMKHGKMVWFLLSSSLCLCLSFFFYPLSFFSLFLANPLPHSKETASCAQQLHRLSSSQEQALRQFSGIFKIEILHFLSINSLFPWTNFYSRSPSQRRCFSSTCNFRDGFYGGLKPRDVDVKLPC